MCSSWTILCILLLSLSFFPMSVFKYILPFDVYYYNIISRAFPHGVIYTIFD